MKDDFSRILKEHIVKYPLMEPQDFGKLAYQGEFGAEHLLSDRQQAESFLMEEWENLPKNSTPQTKEPVNGSFCRFPLSACRSADEVMLLAELFVFAAKTHIGSKEGLSEKIEQMETIKIPGIKEWMAQWKLQGCPPVHHSRTYRENYNPHYRLILQEYADYFGTLSEIYRLMQKKKTALIAIDGRCGSGKTHFAELTANLFPCNVCHMDDFYMPMEQREENWMEIPGGNMDLQRFLDEVLHPLKNGRQAVYCPYDCMKKAMKEVSSLPSDRLTVVEGSYSCHPLLAAEYDLTIFLTCSKKEQRKRLQAREGDYFPVFEKQWIPLEENYLQHYSIEKDSNLAVDTSDFRI